MPALGMLTIRVSWFSSIATWFLHDRLANSTRSLCGIDAMRLERRELQVMGEAG